MLTTTGEWYDGGTMEMPMRPCSQCGHQNLPNSRFCSGCGVPLAPLCPTCGAENLAGSRFCNQCGTPLTAPAAPSGTAGALPPSGPTPSTAVQTPAVSPAVQSPASPVPAPPEERRLVTALFCDLVGFTPLSESLDPEDVRDLQAAYFSAMSEQIARYSGTVEKYAGDAVLALFGAPVAHEDDAERAVLCALQMQGAIVPVAASAQIRWHVTPQIRVGVNTGEVVSGFWDASGRQDVAVTGDALNTAARIQAAAEPGEILVGAETMRLTRRRIRYGERRDVTLKGKAATVPVWPAQGIREEFGERWEGYETPLVGRDREMAVLLDAWARARDGEGQLVSVVGEAGVGKSRLVAEFLGTATASSVVRVVRARCLSYGQEISLWLVADLLRSLFGIKEQEPIADVAMTLRAAVPGLLSRAEACTEALDVLGEVLGLPAGESPVGRAGPQIRRQALIRSLRAVLGAVSERAPMVLVLEDLHWVDNASREVLTEVLADALGVRMLVLAAHRPGWIPPWSEWGWPERVTLRPLGEREASILAGSVLGGVRLSSDLERYVAERAAGNPFFVEEMLRALQESGGLQEQGGEIRLRSGAAERLPSTLTGVLQARLDRLGSEGKHVAQVASVIGRSFAVQLLADVLGQVAEVLEAPLSQLQRAEIAFPRWNPDLEYVFKHVSLRDAAYNTLVQKRRQDLHLQTARAIAARYPSDEYAEMIAYHYARTQAPEAAEWLEKAGGRAEAVYANEEALGHYREALRRTELQPDAVRMTARLEEKIGGVLGLVGKYDEALKHLERAAEIARAERDLETAGRVTATMGITHRWRGTPEEGIALVSPMIDMLSWSGPSKPLAALYSALASLSFILGRYRDQITAAERAADIARAIGDDQLLGEAEERRATALVLLGRSEESVAIFQSAIPLIERGGDPVALLRTLNNASLAYQSLGRLADTRDLLERTLMIAERIGNPDQIAFVLGNLGDCLLRLGLWMEGRVALERARDLIGEQRSGLVASPMLALGEFALWSGEWNEAERLLSDALALAHEIGERQFVEGAQAFLAELDLLSGRPEAAVARLEGVAAAEGVYATVPFMLAWAYLEAGDVDRAAQGIEKVVQKAREETQIRILVEALRVQGMVLQRQGRTQEAIETLTEGLYLARRLPFPYAEARILERLGQREDALAIFRRLGAKKDVERVQRAADASDRVSYTPL